MHSTVKAPHQATSVLMLADGTFFYGQALGYRATISGEICFNTSITGYQEIITDPSYANQIINFTFPHIGNVGTTEQDDESLHLHAMGVIVNNPITSASNFRSVENLNLWLKKHRITGICGVDTRAITRIIRGNGAQNALISSIYPNEELNINLLYNILQNTPPVKGIDMAKQVSTDNDYYWHQGANWDNLLTPHKAIEKLYRVVVIDYGVKLNILRSLYQLGCEVIVVPATASFAEIMTYYPDGVVLSNGPGDPACTAVYAAPVIKETIASGVPLFGICLGHQLLALSVGAKTEKMLQGHRGANHPVKNLSSGKVEITSQNHGFVVQKESLPEGLKITHLSLFDQTIEGIELVGKPVFSVQYHPESSPGPHDSHYLFKQFIENIKLHKAL